MENLRYPIGLFDVNQTVTDELLKVWMYEIEVLPEKAAQAAARLTSDQLNTPYRPGGWAVRQVIHHLADSHINSFIRFKWALTETNPVIKPYDEKKWAELPDSKMPIDCSLQLLTAVHERWTVLLKKMSPDDFEKTFIHPDSGEIKLKTAAGSYAWHGNHHVAHITSLANRKQWL